MKSSLSIAMIVLSSLAWSQATRQYHTNRTDQPLNIDGYLDEESWNLVDWSGDFVQFQPESGAAPSEPTQFKILYDDKNLYIGIRAFDSEPDKIVRRMSRRDGFEGDFVEINIDSYFDKRTAFSFTASASGVKGDEYITNNGDDWDETWDPIWYLKTSVDSLGWVAEFRIPLSQLRFADKPELTWGIQLTRRFFRAEERSTWQHVEQDAPGWVHLFGELKGLKGIKPQRQLEVMPYVLAKTERYEAEEGNPFADGNDPGFAVGVDAKIGITSDVTLDMTINPDFGQVEADPSQVNLTAFRQFFRERRPFFLEGNNILDFPVGEGNNLFYSRRIGRNPSYYPGDDDIAYVDQPNNTRILGAAKLTGKNKNGFSWGLLESVTNKEEAIVQDVDGNRRSEVVEPYTNYLVGRAQQDLDEGKTFFGAMATATNRWIDDPNLTFLHTEAYSAGADVTHNFNDRNYYFSVKTAMSHINGSEEAILLTQTASERYYQRPDNYHKEVDSTLTSMTGNTSSFSIGKQSGDIVFNSNISYMTPALELNDIGFLRQTDQITFDNWLQYRILEPFGKFRYFRINFNQWNEWDFDGVRTNIGTNVNAHTQFKNYIRLSMGSTVRGNRISNADLRGGPSIRYPGGWNIWLFSMSPQQNKFTIRANPYYFRGNNNYAEEYGLFVGMEWQPINSLSFDIRPSVDKGRDAMQYVTTTDSNGDPRYILGEINQTTYRISFRSTFNITPDLSIEYWGQPFMSTGSYSRFKRTMSPSAEQYFDRFEEFDASQISFNTETEEYIVDENRDGNVDYTFGDPDFNVIQFRSNFVTRWEYIPGSTVFVVWSVNGSEYNNLNDNNFSDLANELLVLDARNTFLVKFTYRFRR